MDIIIEQQQESNRDIYHATRFLVEYESVNPFPSPLDNHSNGVDAAKEVVVQSPSLSRPPPPTAAVQSSPSLTPKQRIPPKVVAESLHDVLWIVSSLQDDIPSVAVDRRDLDVNSTWVELMLMQQVDHQQERMAFGH